MTLSHETHDGIALATIDHPPSNLVDGPFFIALLDLLAALEPDDAVRVLVLRSADPDFFLMHGDVEILKDLAPPHTEATEPNVAAATFSRLRTGRLVTIGLLDGFARGGGCELLCGVDMRFGSERAVVGQPEVALGIIAGAGGTVRWPAAVGRGRALDILLTGRDVEAQELYDIGWLDRLVSSAELEAVGLSVAQRIAAMPTGAVPPSTASLMHPAMHSSSRATPSPICWRQAITESAWSASWPPAVRPGRRRRGPWPRSSTQYSTGPPPTDPSREKRLNVR